MGLVNFLYKTRVLGFEMLRCFYGLSDYRTKFQDIFLSNITDSVTLGTPSATIEANWTSGSYLRYVQIMRVRAASLYGTQGLTSLDWPGSFYMRVEITDIISLYFQAACMTGIEEDIQYYRFYFPEGFPQIEQQKHPIGPRWPKGVEDNNNNLI